MGAFYLNDKQVISLFSLNCGVQSLYHNQGEAWYTTTDAKREYPVQW